MKRLRMIDLTMVVSMGLGGVAITPMAEGSLIEFTFGGQLEQVIGSPPSPWDGISVNSEFLVTMVFDSETQDLNNSQFFGRYEFLSLEVMVDGVAQAAATGEIRVDAFSPFHEFNILFLDFPNAGAGSGGSISLVGFSVFDSDAMPTTLDLNDWPISQGFSAGAGNSTFGGVITAFSSRIVPIPGALLPLSIMGLIASTKRRRSH